MGEDKKLGVCVEKHSHHDKLIWANGYGEHPSNDTVYHSASIIKTFIMVVVISYLFSTKFVVKPVLLNFWFQNFIILVGNC